MEVIAGNEGWRLIYNFWGGVHVVTALSCVHVQHINHPCASAWHITCEGTTAGRVGWV